MAANAQTQRDIAAGRSDTAITTLTAADALAMSGDTYTFADEGGVIVANRTRIGEIEVALRRAGLLV